MTTLFSDKTNSFQKIAAIIAIPVIFYLSGAMLVYKLLNRVSINPQQSDFAFFNTVNHGLEIFTGGFFQSFFSIVFIYLVVFSIWFLKLKSYIIIPIGLFLVFAAVETISGRVADKMIADAPPVQFDFIKHKLPPVNIPFLNSDNRFRLLLINKQDYVVLFYGTVPYPMHQNGYRISDADIEGFNCRLISKAVSVR
jgi:hypothetical protein